MEILIVIALSLILVACTVINVTPSGDDKDRPAAVSIQTHQSVDVLGSQVSDSSPKAARGDAQSGDTKGHTSTATPTVVVPITSPIGSPSK